MAQRSKVYYSPLKLDSRSDSVPRKFVRLLKAAGIESLDFDRKFTAIKLHFGESGNLAYLRPNYAKVLVDVVKDLGGLPFLCDCNTLYAGRRKNALEHLDLAYEHGYSPFSTGCHIIIGDGLDGTDEVLVPVKGGSYVKEAKIGKAIMDADIFIALSHFKGHMETGFGGALKNTGMGCASRAGKQEMHSASAPIIDEKLCITCKKCERFCASDAIDYARGTAAINYENCLGCGHCIAACPVDAITTQWDETNEILNAKMAEYSLAVVSGKPSFFISFALDITPLCDCFPTNDLPIVPDIGMFASFDPVALDMACVDAVNAQAPLAGSILADKLAECCAHTNEGNSDHFKTINPECEWRRLIQHAQHIGLGSADYELIEVA